MRSDSEDYRGRIERRINEMYRRTMSSLTVTNPADGIIYLDIAADHAIIRDPNGSLILYANSAPEWGYNNPWQNYPLMLTQQSASSLGVSGPFTTTAWATIYPNQPQMRFTVQTKVGSSTGGVGDYQVAYTVNGGAPTVIPASVGSTTSTTFVTTSFDYVWPSDLFGDRVQILWQARIRPATGSPLVDTVAFSPSRLYGVPA